MTTQLYLSLIPILLALAALLATSRRSTGARRDRSWRLRNARELRVVEPNRRRAP